MEVVPVRNTEDNTELELRRYLLHDLYVPLIQNDPNLNDIYMIRYHWRNRNFKFNNRRARELGIALRRNTVVKRLLFDVTDISLRGTGEIANYIATSPSLKEFKMLSDRTSSRQQHQIMAVVDRFLSAVAYNGQLRILHIPKECSSIPLATALRANRNSLTELEIYFQGSTTNLPVSQGIDEADVVAGSISTLHKLKQIHIICRKDNCITASTIHSLMNHPKLQYLNLTLYRIGRINAPAFAFSLQDLFRSTTPLEDVSLSCLSLANEFTDVLPIIFAGFYGHQTIRSLSLQFCTRNDENAIVVCDLLQNNPGISHLTVQVDTMHGFALIVESLDNNETLSSLDVNITNASKADLFNINACRRLEKALCSMKYVTKLSFEVDSHPDNIAFPPEIINGLEGNYCLTDVDFYWEDHNIDKEHRLAKYYTERNNWIPKLLDATTKDEILNLFLEIEEKEEEENYWYENEESDYFLTIVYETLRRKDFFW